MNASWTKINFYHSGDEYFRSIVDGVRRAKKSILIESYIFSVDPITNILLEELRAAVARGVQVQLIIDGFGSYYWIDSLKNICRKNNIPLRVYHPLPRNFRWFQLFSIKHLLRFSSLVRRLNRRNHRKIVCIDDELLWVGSLNLTQEHSESVMGIKAWRDSAVQLEGSSVELAIRAHNLTWNDAGKERLFQRLLGLAKQRKPLLPMDALRINYSQKMRYRLYKDLIKRINSAQSKISITSAYFLPKRSFLRALKKAKQRGCEIQIIIPGPSDVPLVKMASYNILKWLTKNNIEVFEFQNRVLHAKYMLIDQWSSIGSSNLNHRSFLHDLEIEAVLTDSDSIEHLNNQFQLDLRSSLQIKLSDLKKMPWGYRFFARIAFSIRYLL